MKLILLYQILFFSLLTVQSYTQVEMRGPEFVTTKTNVPASSSNNIIYKFYKSLISPADGDRCSMIPSCSEYMKQAIQKHGLLRGLLLGLDRLTRCSNDLYKYKKVHITEREYYIDEVP